jgi:GNAT superfamily N-acetyltransferase
VKYRIDEAVGAETTIGIAARTRSGGPVLRHLDAGNNDAISGLLRRRVELWSGATDIPSPASRWMAGVYVADELTSLVQAREGVLAGSVEAMLFVDPGWRRQGIGTLLLQATMDWASDRKANSLRLNCERTDWPMRQFAGKFGARLDLVLGELVADIPLGRLRRETPGG